MSETRLNHLRRKIEAGDARFAGSLITNVFTDEDRRLAARELPGILKRIRRRHPDLGWTEPWIASALRVAGAGCITGPAAAAQWLARADLRLSRVFAGADGWRRHAELAVAATEHRPAQWRAEVGRRLAGRLRVADQSEWGGDEIMWWTCALLLRAAGEGPPADEAFAVGWVRWTNPAVDPADDPLLDAMVPRLFEVESVGQVITRFDTSDSWRKALLKLMREGRLRRDALLDGCLRRFLRGGTPNDLYFYADLHNALAPDIAESTARVRDYLRLLPTAPTLVAELALHEVRRVDEAGSLDEDAYIEAAQALLFREEKKLVRAALGWLDEAVRRDGSRVDATMDALTVAFGHESNPLRERAAKIAVKHGAKAGDQARDAVRAAATSLPADLRDRIADVFGEVEAPAPMPSSVLTPPPPPAAFPAPIASVAELAEALIAPHWYEATWIECERLLAGLVEFAHRDPDGLKAALKPVFQAEPAYYWYRSNDFGVSAMEIIAPFSVARVVLDPRLRPNGVSGRPRPSVRPLERFLARRTLEIAMMIGRTPMLVSTPTLENGRLDAETLVARLERLEAQSCEPGPVDLAQALLRLPPPAEADPETVARAGRLISPSGRTLATWLETGGLGEVTFETVATRHPWPPGIAPPPAVVAVATPVTGPTISGLPVSQVASELGPLCEFPRSKKRWWSDPQYYFNFEYVNRIPWSGPVLPSHTDLAATHVLPQLVSSMEHACDQGEVLLGLAGLDGPVGVATATALAYGLSVQPVKERTGAVDALLLMAARGRLPAAEMGAAVGELVVHRIAKLGRVASALGEAADAGAHAQVWTVIEHALPSVLRANADKPVTGMADLLALGGRLAEATGARARIPELEALAARKGSSRTLKEAARLHRHLTRG
jgi:hypothetical protein